MVRNTASERIALLRPVLIFLVMTTHIPGSMYRPDMIGRPLDVGNYLHAMLSGVIAVGALPLLSIISGYLALFTFQKYGYGQTLQKKFYRLFLPMLFWNLLFALYIYSVQASGTSFRPDLKLYPLFPLSVDWVLGVLALFKLPANPPLYFLRELLLCFVLLPLLSRAARRWYTAVPLMLLIAWMAVNRIHLYFFLRIDIYGFFVLGLFLAHHRAELAGVRQWLSRAWVQVLYLAGCAVFAALLARYAFQVPNQNFFKLMKLGTLLAPLAFWMLSAYVVGWPKRFLLWVSPVSFAVFLGHVPVQSLMFSLWSNYFGRNPLEQDYFKFWSLSMLMCFLVMGLLWIAYTRARRKILHAEKS